MQDAGYEAVVSLLRMSRNTADAAKAVRPKGENFHDISGLIVQPPRCVKAGPSSVGLLLVFLQGTVYNIL